MSYKFDLTKKLLEYVEMYENEQDSSDIEAFSLFLSEQVFASKKMHSSEKFEKESYKEYKSFPEIEFSTLLTNLNRFAKHYIKKAFKDTEIKTLDEFGFLATLLQQGSLLKNQLINQHLLEISSGSEVIRRLKKNGLLEEFPDDVDRRAKRVSISEKGKGVLFVAFQDMAKISEIVIGNLTTEEVKEVNQIFNKLSYFHHQIHETDREAGIDEIHEKYVVS